VEKRGTEDASQESRGLLPPSFAAHCAHSRGDPFQCVQSSGKVGDGKDEVFVHTKITSFPAPTMKIVMDTLFNAAP
jgi:hypothetical protein